MTEALDVIAEIIFEAAVILFMFTTRKYLKEIDIELEKQKKKTDYFIEIIGKALQEAKRKEKENGHQQRHTYRETN